MDILFPRLLRSNFRNGRMRQHELLNPKIQNNNSK